MMNRHFCQALSISVAAALLSACGALRQAQDDMPPIGAAATVPQNIEPGSSLSIINRFITPARSKRSRCPEASGDSM